MRNTFCVPFDKFNVNDMDDVLRWQCRIPVEVEVAAAVVTIKGYSTTWESRLLLISVI